MAIPNLFRLTDPSEQRFLYELTDLDDVPNDILADTRGARISIGEHNADSTMNGKYLVGVEVKQLIVGLEAQGRYKAAEFFLRHAAREDLTSNSEITSSIDGLLLYPGGNEVPPVEDEELYL